MWRWVSLGVLFNHIFFDLLLLLLPRVCWSVCECVCSSDKSISLKNGYYTVFMCAETCGFSVSVPVCAHVCVL